MPFRTKETVSSPSTPEVQTGTGLFIILSSTAPIPNGTPAGTLIVRTDTYTPPVPVAAAPQVVGTATSFQTQNPVASLTLNKPAGVQDGDLLVALVHFQTAVGDTAPAGPAGWTVGAHIGNSVSSAQRATALLYLPVPSASALTATTFTFTNGTPVRCLGTMFIVRGADLTNPIAVAGGFGSDASFGVARTMPPIIVPENDCLVVGEWQMQVTSDIAAFPDTGLPGTDSDASMALVYAGVTGPTTGVTGRSVMIVRAKSDVDAGSNSAGTISPGTANAWGSAVTGGVVVAIRKKAA